VGGEDIRKECRSEYGENVMYSCENGTMRPVETVPGTAGQGDKGE
jgi:hypothetical protein